MVRKLIILLTIILIACSAPKKCCAQAKTIDVKRLLKFSTFYAAVNGGTSLSDVDIFSVDNGLSTQTISTPYDYNFTIGLRKIARFGYENKAKTFYDAYTFLMPQRILRQQNHLLNTLALKQKSLYIIHLDNHHQN